MTRKILFPHFDSIEFYLGIE